MTKAKVVVVAGAGPGNGAALAQRFAGKGQPVAMLDASARVPSGAMSG